MAISKQMIDELVRMTGAAQADCQKALEASNGDIGLAVEWLNRHGINQAAINKEDERAAEAAAVMEDTALTEVVASAAESVQEEDAVAKAMASEMDAALGGRK